MVFLLEGFQRLVCGTSYVGSNPTEDPNTAGIAQLVERLFRNQKVAGSNPVSGSKSTTFLAINGKK